MADKDLDETLIDLHKTFINKPVDALVRAGGAIQDLARPVTNALGITKKPSQAALPPTREDLEARGGGLKTLRVGEPIETKPLPVRRPKPEPESSSDLWTERGNE